MDNIARPAPQNESGSLSVRPGWPSGDPLVWNVFLRRPKKNIFGEQDDMYQ